jgi:nitroreductase
MPKYKFTPLPSYQEYTPEEMIERSAAFYADMKRRRTVRQFSDRAVSRKVIENCLRAAATSPSGANIQPWHFVIVSDPAIKNQIFQAAETVESDFYGSEATKEWVQDLASLGTDANKPFLLSAPYLIVIFAQRFGLSPEGKRKKHYYVSESVGIATGILVTAVHQAGLVSLTYTPSKIKFLNKILSRPSNEKPYLILVVGFPAENTVVPEIYKKSLAEYSTFL